MRILVTGGAGFLGSHLCRSLVNKGHHVTAVDNLYTGNLQNIVDLFDHKDFKFKEHDIIEPFDVDCEGIFNLACPASPIQYQRNPIYTLRTNFLGSVNVLELASRNKATVLQASTSEIYGDPLVNPQVETYLGNVNTIGIRSCYDEGKRVAETLFNDFYRLYETKIQIARIFNTYGPNMQHDDGRVVSNFIVQAINNRDITIYGSGKQTRSFCYVDDLIEGLIKLFFKENYTGPINLGNPDPVSILNLANEIIQLTDSNSKIVFNELPGDDPKLREPNINRATSILDWKPKVARRDGLQATISYFRERL